MKKAIALIVSVLFVFALSSVSFAAEKAAAPAKAEEKKAAAAPATAAPKAEEKKPAAAPAKAEEKKAEPAKAGKKRQVTGEVAAVDAKANTITVKGKKGDVTASVNDKTKVMAGKDKKALADVKAGDKVTVYYTEADGKNAANSIEIKPAAAPKKAEEKKAEPAKAAPAPAKAEEKKPAAAPAPAAPKAEEKKPAAAPAKKSSGY